jgi:ABC-2 type transport system ATP-binding protein
MTTKLEPLTAATYAVSDRPAIMIQGVSKAYGSVSAVRTIDLDVQSGSVLALLGPNGAGKSTTLSMLLGLSTPDAGRIEICGLSPAEAVRRGRIAAMLQTAGLMPGVTIREVLGLAQRAYPRPLDVDEAMEMAGLTQVAGRRVDKLSGGQAQRVRFALVAVANPDILLLDEPTTAMDVAGRQEFWESMRAYAECGHTVVFATHYLDEVAENADRVVVMAAGRIAADGTPASIRALAGASTVRFTVPDGATLPRMPEATTVDLHGDRVTVRTADPDATVRALAASTVRWSDLEVAAASLDDSFRKLTSTDGATS